MRSTRHVFTLACAVALAAGLSAPAVAQQTIKIGELNSYKSQPAFLDPYKKGWEMAVEEINAKGGVLGKKLEVVSRDDGANPGTAVRAAEELVTREGVAAIAGTFLSHVGLAVTKRFQNEVRRRVGIVFQDPDDQLFMATARDDVAFVPANFGIPGDELEHRVDAALHAVGMECYGYLAPNNLI